MWQETAGSADSSHRTAETQVGQDSWRPREPRLSRKNCPVLTRRPVQGVKRLAALFFPDQSRWRVFVELHLCALPVFVYLGFSFLSLHPPSNHFDAATQFQLVSESGRTTVPTQKGGTVI